MEKKYEELLIAVRQMVVEQGEAFSAISREMVAYSSDEEEDEIKRYANSTCCNYETYYCLR